jgi:aldehyde dehydrogenase (NAD+)
MIWFVLVNIYTLVTRALQFVEQLRVDSVWVNQHNEISFQAPFGVFKQLGLSRELGRYGLEEYYEVKTTSIKIE